MTVRKEVAKREDEAKERAAQPTLVQIAEQTLTTHAEMLSAILPPSVDRRRFFQMTIQAVRSAPELMRCFRTKQGTAAFLLAAGEAAMVGLEPNTPTQECWILPRKRGNVQEAHLLIGYRGILKMARRTGTSKAIVAEVVRENDHFAYGYGQDGPWLEWKPAAGERGELTHAFAISWTMDGGRAQTVLDRFQVEQRRAKSDSWRSEKGRPHSPWTLWPESMWRKSAIKAHSPWLDLSVEAETVLSREEQALSWNPATGTIEAAEVFGAIEAGDAEGSEGAPELSEAQPATEVREARSKPARASRGRQSGSSEPEPQPAEPVTDSSGREYAPDDPERPM